MKIKKHTASSLKEFLESETYRNMPFRPVSPQRAKSWIHNPRLKPDDILLYLGYEENEMIAYRCILPDSFREIRFGWLSGNWVRPDRRREGLASRLFDEAFTDWGHQLMYTNYAPESKAVYDKTGRFELYRELEGIRYYQRSVSAKLLGSRTTVYQRSRPLLELADLAINLVQDIRIAAGRSKFSQQEAEESGSPDAESVDFIRKNQSGGFCLRGEEEFGWITEYPWIIENHKPDRSYHFSSHSRRFRNICLKIRSSNGEMSAFLWLVVNAEKMSIPYLAIDREQLPARSEETMELINGLIRDYMQKLRVAYLSTYHPLLIQNFKPGPLLGSRPMHQNYFASRELIRQLPDPLSVQFQDGDGDVVFV